MNCWLKSAKKEEVAALVGELAGARGEGRAEVQYEGGEVRGGDVLAMEKAANSTCGGTRVH